MLVLGRYVKNVLLVNDGNFVSEDLYLPSTFHDETQVVVFSPITVPQYCTTCSCNYVIKSVHLGTNLTLHQHVFY